MLNFKEFVCLNERLFYEGSSDDSEELEVNDNNTMKISKHDETLMMQHQLL